MSFNVGENVGPYRVIEQLGQGGMATVYKAYHAALDRYVAIKVLHPAFLEDSSFLARFQREARVVAKLDQPNIVPIYDYAEHEGRPYLVMKFIEGETLKARISGSSPAAEEISHIVESVGAALAFAHKRGILHRDVKPSNVLMANDGEIYLADFGLARIAQTGESTLTNDMIVGTPQYISPEQALGKKELDEGTDIYSFGVMLYEMTVGRVPFSADTPFSIIHDHIYTPLPLPRSVNPDLSEDVERVLLKALSKERADRYPNVRAFVDAFQQAWQSAPAAGADRQPAAIPEAKTQAVDVAATVPAAAAASESATRTPVPAPPAAEQTGSQTKRIKPKRKFPWMWLAMFIVLLLGCMVTVWALRSTRQFRLSITPPAGIEETLAPLQTPQNFLDIGQAMQAVEANPDDPTAHLQLALAYQQAQMTDKAQDEFTSVEKLAGGEDFLWNAARQAAAANAWLGAARLSLDAAEIRFAAKGSLPEDLSTLLHETVYKAAKEPQAGGLLAYDRLAAIDEPLAKLFQARFAFLTGDPEGGRQMLDELMALKPDFIEGILLQADMSARRGQTEEARLLLEQIKNDPQAPGWVLSEVNLIEGTLP